MLRTLVLALAMLLLLAALVGTGTAAAANPKPPRIKTQPTSVAVEEGQSATFSATAVGTPTPTIQWELSTDGGLIFSPIAGATSEQLTIADVNLLESGDEYRTVFTNSAGTATTQAATLTVQNMPRVTEQPVSLTVEEGHNATFEASASGYPAPTVRWELSTDAGKKWSIIAGASSDQLTITDTTTAMNGYEYRAVFVNPAGYAITDVVTLTVQRFPSVTKQPLDSSIEEGHNATFESSASGFPAPTVQWEVSSDAGKDWSPITGASADVLTIVDASTSMNGYEYRAVFTNAAGSIASDAATLTVSARPVVTEQPAGTTVEVGETAAFEASATGLPAPTVQWQLSTNAGASWSAVSGGTSDRLTVHTTSATEDGDEYRAVFTNSAGSTTSDAVTLTVTTSHYAAVGWGRNTAGDLGNGTSGGSSDVPVSVKSLKFVTSVAAGEKHSLALLADGTVMAWGANGNGQLGDGETFASSVPVEVEGLTHVTAIAAGASDSLALLSNGTVEAWGDNENGQLGIGGTSEAVELPAAVKGLTGVKAIAAGAEFSLALLENGKVMAWGANESGQLGTGDTKQSDVPVAIKGLSEVKAIAAGGEFALALLNNGTVEAWGSDNSGQLANAGAAEAGLSETPVAVESLSGVEAIAAGARHALALMSGGTMMAWGENTDGELGDGSFAARQETPVSVSGLSGATAISAGEGSSVALLGSGSIMAWGNDHYGQLGNGTTGGMSDVPVSVIGLTKAVSVAAGRDHVIAYGEPIPGVASVSPGTGPDAGGETVTISGADFTGATAVKFGTVEAKHFTVESASTITATVPAGSGEVDVTVTTPAGTSPPSSTDRYTYRGVPSIKKLLIKSGPAKGGTSVTITGHELTGASSVSFGEVSTHEITANSSTSITVLSPRSTAGTAYVTVTTPGGTSPVTSKARYRYFPTVEAVSPATGSTLGGTGVTVTGSGFALGTTATTFAFGALAAQSVDCTSATSCTMISPAQSAGTVNVTATVAKLTSPVNAAGDQFEYD